MLSDVSVKTHISYLKHVLAHLRKKSYSGKE